MVHLGARRLRLPQLALAPECVDAAALRQHWALLAAVLLEDGGAPLSAESLEAASAAGAGAEPPTAASDALPSSRQMTRGPWRRNSHHYRNALSSQHPPGFQ